MTECPPPAAPAWDRIDTVLLDMDGTLLDRRFDDHFWLRHVPLRYAEKSGISVEAAGRELFRRYRAHERTLNWTDLDFWSRELHLDIPALKRQVDHLIAVHPRVKAFLGWLRSERKRIWLVTNAHGKTLDLKMEKTRLARWFERIILSHDIGFPKEDVRFWGELRSREPFDPARTLLAEDTVDVLESAARFGVAYLVQVARYSSASPPADPGRFFAIQTFEEIMPPPRSR